MRPRIVLSLVLAALLPPAAAPAQFIQRTTCYRADAPVQVDGRLDEAQWSRTERLGPFRETESGTQTRYLTFGRLLWDDQYLYVAIEAQDPDIWATRTQRDGNLWTEEVLEVFVDPDGDGRDYVEWEINPLGTALDIHMVQSYADGGPANVRWNGEGVRSAVYVEGTVQDRADRDRQWSAEWAIPWEALAPFGNGRAAPPADGDQWRLGLYRTDRTATGSVENSAWSPTRDPSFHTPSRFGAVLFSSQQIGERAVLGLDGPVVMDGAGVGNGNGRPDPGEETAISFTLTNYGRTPAEGLGGVLRSLTPAAIVTDSVATLGALGPGQRLPVTGFQVRVAAGYEPQTPLPLVLTLTDVAGHLWVEGLDLYLDAVTTQPVILSGTVRDPQGQVVAGAVVTAAGGEGEFSSTTDAAGRFAVELPEGRYQVRIDPPPGSPLGTTHHGETVVLRADGEVDLVLAKTHAIVGRITDPAGNPIAGVTVSISGIFSDEYRSFEALTGDDGTYVLVVPRPSYYALRAEPGETGFGMWLDNDLPALDGELTVDLVLSRAFTLSGTVRDPEGNPVTGMTLSVVVDGAGYSDDVQVGSDGSYRLNLPAGTYDLRLQSFGSSPLPDQGIPGVTIDGNEARDLHLLAGHRLNIDLVGAAGEAISGGWVFLTGDEVSTGLNGDGSGHFEATVLPGEYTVGVSQPPAPYVDPPDTVVSIRSDTTLTLVLQTGLQVKGTLSDAAGTAYGGVLVFLGEAGASGFAVVSPAGGYAASLAPGRYTVIAQSMDDLALIFPIQEVGQIEVRQDSAIDFTLVVGLPVTGRLVDVTGQPVRGSILFATSVRQGISGVAQTSADGRFEINLLPGDYDILSVLPPDEETVRVGSAAVPADGPVELRLPGGAVLAGRITGGGEEVYVYLQPASRGAPRLFGYAYLAASGAADEEGRYRFQVDPGPYHVIALSSVSAPGTGRAIAAVAVDGEVTLDLALPTGDMAHITGQVWREDGGAAAAALVQLYDPTTGVIAYQATGSGGQYELAVPRGEYRATVALSGFLGAIESIYDMGALVVTGDRQWDIRLANAASAVAEGEALPGAFALAANYPNPFNPVTTIEYDLAAAVPVELTIHNAVGQRVRRLVAATQMAGHYTVAWDGRDDGGHPAASGVYFCALRAGDAFARVRSMLLLR